MKTQIKEENHALDQAECQMGSVACMVAALNCDYDRLEELREAKQLFTAGWNMPGFMPDSESLNCADFEEAKHAIIDQLIFCEDHAENEDLAESYSHNAQDINLESKPFNVVIENMCYWVTESHQFGLDDDDYQELLELEDQHNDCENQDEARERIEQDALCVDVRSSWHSPGDTDNAKPDQFRIVLCTGGPHVEIQGDLSEYGEPENCKLYYQDWFTGLSEYTGDQLDSDALEQYCSVFYFGE